MVLTMTADAVMAILRSGKRREQFLTIPLLPAPENLQQ
jgi:hypothetical protein